MNSNGFPALCAMGKFFLFMMIFGVGLLLALAAAIIMM